jgi:hypothetical protein
MKLELQISRIGWLVPTVILCDAATTLAGQPPTYWSRPHTAMEGNPFFAWFLTQGWMPFAALTVVYAAASFLLVTKTPARIGFLAFFAFVFGHFFGISSWMFLIFGWGISAPILFGVVLSLVIVTLGTATNTD